MTSQIFTIPTPLIAHLEELSARLPPAAPHDLTKVALTVPSPNPPTKLTPIVAKVEEYVKSKVPPYVVNHSYRCYAWGVLLASRFGWDTPEHGWDPELWLLTALLHDIGCTQECNANPDCRLSFEIWGGIRARELLTQLGASQIEADEVCEAIVRHTEDQDGSPVRVYTALMHLGPSQDFRAVFTPKFIHEESLAAVCKLYPRLNMEVGFNATFGGEVINKPECWSARWAPVMLKAIGTEGVPAYHGIA